MSHHWGTWPNVQTFTASYSGPDFTQGFHTFAIEWWPGSLQWFVDDVLRATSLSNIPQMPFYIILNAAVGGNWPGNPDGSTVFPQLHEIDYVRVYMPDDPGPPLSDFVDTTLESAVPDGVLNPVEYVASTQGLNGGLGDRIGRNSTFYIDSSSDGRLNIGFDANNPWIEPYGVVVYLDTAPGGLVSTLDLTDTADRTRRLTTGKGQSGERADLYFAPGFRADYAISLDLNTSAIYQLGTGSLPLINGADLDAPNDLFGGQDVIYRIDDGSAGSRVREFEARLSHFGLAPGDAFTFIVTMLNANTLFRSNEFVGVAPGNEWDTFNPGASATVVKPGDFHRFQSIVCGLLGDLNCDGIANEGDIGPFTTALIDPTAYGAGFPSCDLCTGDFDGDGSVNGLDIDAFVTLLTGG
ncbi:MAG: family 16 glycosylhydrolase [Phycisphaerae bacterium]